LRVCASAHRQCGDSNAACGLTRADLTIVKKEAHARFDYGASEPPVAACMNALPAVIFSGFDVACLAMAALLLLCGFARRLRPYRQLLWGGGILLLLTAVYPGRSNPLGHYLFFQGSGEQRLPPELPKVIWWILGAWLLKSLLDLILRRTIFPDDNQPHARQLFADLASALIYVVAFVGIVDVVFKQPISTVLATSGVLAIVLGLALQSTLADVFSGLALNIERSFAAGDWIATKDGVEGQIIEINWRVARIRTGCNDLVVIPNSLVAKAIVTNHSRLSMPHIGTLRLGVHHEVAPGRVIGILKQATEKVEGIAADTTPSAYACAFDDIMVTYELDFAVSDFTVLAEVQSHVIQQVLAGLQAAGIAVGRPVTDVRAWCEAVAGREY